jgi:hypothetical protein
VRLILDTNITFGLFVSNRIEILAKTVAPPPIQAGFNSAAHY